MPQAGPLTHDERRDYALGRRSFERENDEASLCHILFEQAAPLILHDLYAGSSVYVKEHRMPPAVVEARRFRDPVVQRLTAVGLQRAELGRPMLR